MMKMHSTNNGDSGASVNRTGSNNVIHIKRSKGWQFIRIEEIKEYRDLIFLLAQRDFKVRYSQSILGALWALLQPFITMVVFSVFFGKFGKIPSDGVAYPLFSFSALVPWTYFAKAVSVSSTSLVGSTNLLSKVYFPRFIIPLTPVLSGLIDFAIAFTTLVCMMVYFSIYPSLSMLMIPFLLLLMMLTAFGVGALLAALNAKYRDINHVAVFLVQLWMFISPVVYPTSMIPEKYSLIFELNPLAGIIEGFRWALLGNISFPAEMLICSTLVSSMLFVVGLLYFKQMERYFADII
jgi:lipopolysaccharide transport system permease protein